MLDVRDASARILAEVHRLPAERIALLDTLGRVLAEDVIAPITLPLWPNSSMDGYAVGALDGDQLPVRLVVVQEIAAGQFPARGLGAGEAMKVMTGAPVPEGAESVIRIEDTDHGIQEVEIRAARDIGKNIRPAGEDFRAGDTILNEGITVTPAVLGVLASVGMQSVAVTRQPTVAIISSGDELVPVEQFQAVRDGRRIVSSNSYSLHALVRSAGGVPVDLGVAADTPESLREKVEAARGCDLIMTSAGVSIGDHDHTRKVFAAMGTALKFWKVRIRPGAPLAFGVIGRTPWIGLSGNPVSAMVTFELFVRPVIRKMRGETALFPTAVSVTLEQPITTAVPLTHFLRAIVRRTTDGFTARLTGSQSSAVLSGMAHANALLVVPYDRQTYAAGDVLTAIPLGDALSTTETFPI